jgi:rRNA biogenesis protein RRP5
MVFYLQMAEIDKARAVAEKALKTIIFNEEAERLNVWVALLNLESMYGSSETVERVMNRATQNCDSLKVHFHMAEIYARGEKPNEAETIFVKMTKKFGRVTDVWVKYGVFHYKNGHCELARKLLLKSFGSLDKKDRMFCLRYLFFLF